MPGPAVFPVTGSGGLPGVALMVGWNSVADGLPAGVASPAGVADGGLASPGARWPASADVEAEPEAEPADATEVPAAASAPRPVGVALA